MAERLYFYKYKARAQSQSQQDMKSITSLLSQTVHKIKLAYSHDGERAGIEHRVANTYDDVIEDGGDKAQKHESNCECDHDNWYLMMNNYVLIYSLFYKDSKNNRIIQINTHLFSINMQ